MRVVRWRAASGEGLEHLILAEAPDGITASGIVIGDRGEAPFGLSYRIICAPDWSVRALFIQVAGGESLHILADGGGSWRDASGAARPDLAGCIDIDIAATPFTNTLPIRRLVLARGERRVIRVAYVSVPSLQVRPVEQAYTCLDPAGDYRYENLSSRFVAELRTDGNGLVRDYPGLFRRL